MILVRARWKRYGQFLLACRSLAGFGLILNLRRAIAYAYAPALAWKKEF